MTLLASVADPAVAHRWLVDDKIAALRIDGTFDLPETESAAVVLDGTAEWDGGPLRRGDGVFSPAGSSCRLTAARDRRSARAAPDREPTSTTREKVAIWLRRSTPPVGTILAPHASLTSIGAGGRPARGVIR